jgi:hypothetical protein
MNSVSFHDAFCFFQQLREKILKGLDPMEELRPVFVFFSSEQFMRLIKSLSECSKAHNNIYFDFCFEIENIRYFSWKKKLTLLIS